ncbi:MAG: LLM class F420-dependent oxidoreductase, partial [Thermomicrobiales bacterium]
MDMRIGAIFPQLEIGTDLAEMRAYLEAVRDAGYDHLAIYDHVLGADPADRPGWDRYTHEDSFHEVFVFLAWAAAVVPGLELVVDVLVLPQRQTALVAKQAATLDLLTGGRLRLGVGVGWNAVEYEALGESFGTRGARVEEQIALLRALWTDRVVTFAGQHHTVTAAGLHPMPVQRPIPVWIGGGAGVTLRRAGRLGDGWFPQGAPDADMAEKIAQVHAHAADAGRPPGAVGIQGLLRHAATPPEEWVEEIGRWSAVGATHLGIDTMRAGYASVEDHIDAVRRFA